MATLGYFRRNHCIVDTLGGWSCHDGLAYSSAGGRWSIDLDGQDQIRCWRTDGHIRNQIHPWRHGHGGSTQAGSQYRGIDANRPCSWGILDTVHPDTVYGKKDAIRSTSIQRGGSDGVNSKGVYTRRIVAYLYPMITAVDRTEETSYGVAHVQSGSSQGISGDRPYFLRIVIGESRVCGKPAIPTVCRTEDAVSIGSDIDGASLAGIDCNTWSRGSREACIHRSPSGTAVC